MIHKKIYKIKTDLNSFSIYSKTHFESVYKGFILTLFNLDTDCLEFHYSKSCYSLDDPSTVNKFVIVGRKRGSLREMHLLELSLSKAIASESIKNFPLTAKTLRILSIFGHELNKDKSRVRKCIKCL